MGILGAIILGFARAIGETMAVTMVIGTSISMDNTITSPGYTIASILANQFNNADTDAEKHALVYAAFLLLVITTLINTLARIMIMHVSRRKSPAIYARPGLGRRLLAFVTRTRLLDPYPPPVKP
jgi:phosphate transport system permease protein